MRLGSVLSGTVMTAAFCCVVAAQTEDSPTPPPAEPAKEQVSPCPSITVQSPTPRRVREGQPISFVAQIRGGDKSVTPSLVWQLSAGVIKDGQGTPQIQVDSTGGGIYRAIAAELWVGGYAPECNSRPEPYVIQIVPPASKADEFGELAPDDEKKHIEAGVNYLTQSSDNLFVIAYAGRSSERGHASAALRRIRDQFVRSGVSANRLATIDGGFREQPAYEFWIVPDGAIPPQPTPTIDRKDIVYPKPTRGRKP